MQINVGMPKFGLSMEEGTISTWLVKEGDAVKKGDPIAEIQSEKLSNNAVAPCDGTLVKILLGEGESAPCGNDICVIACAGEDPEAIPAKASGKTLPKEPVPSQKPEPATKPPRKNTCTAGGYQFVFHCWNG